MTERKSGFLTPDLPAPTGFTCRRFRIPDDPAFLRNFWGSVLELCDSFNWEDFGTMPAAQAAALAQTMYFDAVDTGEACLIGIIMPYATATLPPHMLACDGSTHLRTDFPALYAALDAAFIVDADHFITPDMRDNVAIGAGMTYSVGQTGGEATHTLTLTELPSHTHTDAGHAHAEGIAAPNATTIGPGAPQPTAIPAAGVTGAASAAIQPAGGGGAHNNIQPYLAIKWGIFYE